MGCSLARWVADIAREVGKFAREIADMADMGGKDEGEVRTSCSWFGNLVLVV